MRVSRLRLACLIAAAGLAPAAPALAQQATRPVLPLTLSVTGRGLVGAGLQDSLASAYGGGLGLRADVWPDRTFGLTVTVGADQLALAHADGQERLGPRAVLNTPQTVRRWDWGHWRVQYRNHVRDIARDTNYAVTLTPVQSARTLSLAVMPAYRLRRGPVEATLQAGPSLTFAQRRMYLDEDWAKTFPDSAYTFPYRIPNHAPDKRGLAFGLDAVVAGSVHVRGPLYLTGSLGARQILGQRRTERVREGVDPNNNGITGGADAAFPLRTLLMAEFGIALR